MGKKKLQGADGINFQMQLTIKGLETVTFPKETLTNESGNRAYDYANEKDDTQAVQSKALQLMSQMPKVMNSNHANRITKVLTDSINSGVIGSKAVLELLKYPAYADMVSAKIRERAFEGSKSSAEQAFDRLKESELKEAEQGLASVYMQGFHLRNVKGYKVAHIKTPHIEAFYRTLVDDYATGTIKRFANVLNLIFKTAKRYSMIENNPCQDAQKPKRKDEDEGLKFFTPKQALMFMKSLNMSYEVTYKGHQRIDDTGKPYYVNEYTESYTVPTQYKVFFTLSLFCGFRKGETLALHWNDIDFKEKKISISKSVGMTENGFDYKEPKTKKSVRKVSIPDDVIPLLKQYHFEYIQTRFSHGTAWQGDLSNGGNLFIQADGKLMGHTTPYQYFTKHLHRYNEWVQNNPDKAKAEGLEELPIIPLHGLRHSCATLLNYLEVNIIEISKTLGHSTCSTTMNIYAHSFEEQQEEVATKVNEFLRLNA